MVHGSLVQNLRGKYGPSIEFAFEVKIEENHKDCDTEVPGKMAIGVLLAGFQRPDPGPGPNKIYNYDGAWYIETGQGALYLNGIHQDTIHQKIEAPSEIDVRIVGETPAYPNSLAIQFLLNGIPVTNYAESMNLNSLLTDRLIPFVGITCQYDRVKRLSSPYHNLMYMDY